MVSIVDRSFIPKSLITSGISCAWSRVYIKAAAGNDGGTMETGNEIQRVGNRPADGKMERWTSASNISSISIVPYDGGWKRWIVLENVGRCWKVCASASDVAQLKNG